MSVSKVLKAAPASLKLAGAVVGFLSAVAGAVPLYSMIFDGKGHESQIIGRWEGDYSYPVTDGVSSFKGVTTYLHGGKYNVAGVITVQGKVEAQPYKLAYGVSGAGNWSVANDLLSITLTDIRSLPKSMNVGGADIDYQQIERILGQPLPSLNNAYPSGISDEFEVEKVEPDHLTLIGKDPFGKPYTIELKRQLAAN